MWMFPTTKIYKEKSEIKKNIKKKSRNFRNFFPALSPPVWASVSRIALSTPGGCSSLAWTYSTGTSGASGRTRRTLGTTGTRSLRPRRAPPSPRPRCPVPCFSWFPIYNFAGLPGNIRESSRIFAGGTRRVPRDRPAFRRKRRFAPVFPFGNGNARPERKTARNRAGTVRPVFSATWPNRSRNRRTPPGRCRTPFRASPPSSGRRRGDPFQGRRRR